MTTLRKISIFLMLALLLAPDVPRAEEITVQEDQETEAAAPSLPMKEGTAGAYLSGQFARSSGDIEGAIEYLRQAYARDPHDSEIMRQLQALLLVNGNIAEAVQLVKETQAASKTPLNAFLLCLDAAKRQDLAGARKILDDAADVSIGQLWAPLVAAWLDVGRQKIAKPVTLEGWHTDAGHAAALTNYHLALINTQAGFIDAATENFRKSISDSANPPARVMMMMAKFYDEHGQPQVLAPLVISWRKDNPDSRLVSEDIANAFTPQDGIAEVLFTMGSVVQSAGAPQDAIIYLQMARYVKPEFPLVIISLGDAYTELKQYDKANAIYGMVSLKSPFYARAQLRIGLNYNQNNAPDSALATFERLSQALPKNYEPLVAKADLLRGQQRFIEAVDAYTQALARIPQVENYHWPIFFARGVCLERQNKWIEAEADLQKALALKPDQPDVLNYLGYSWIMQGERLEEAQKMIEKAASQRPNDPQIADSMGWALYSLARYDEAVTYLEKALEMLPGDPTINDHLGDAYWQLGRKTEARYQWERSLIFSPPPGDAALIQKKLKDGLAIRTSQAAVSPIVAETARPDVSVR